MLHAVQETETDHDPPLADEAAGRSVEPFLVQTYRRDMGGGHFVMMKDISAPITVRGRHWGGLRLAVKI